MDAMTGGAVAVATSPSGFPHPQHMRPRPLAASALRTRALDGSYPFRSHRTCAELGL